MPKTLLLLAILLSAASVQADDTEFYEVARSIKSKVLKKVSKSEASGFCDLMIELRHRENYARIVSVKATGSYELCKVSKSALKKNQKFKYDEPEKYIRIHVEN
ncbi:hypothetical protein [Vibrio sp. SCSIO 43136]|uniref:hypothetical protein n=1 Tax=Vibrio sp. SCSIO 43136 TaxID=2819101 RepID=UPI00207577DF|nr:hypothetical protein [Vibrio sp. SCSIO 43136]USD66540.1 hypothetical protein J4N39_06990 [Vibrio sp. SCSIO 43136]